MVIWTPLLLRESYHTAKGDRGGMVKVVKPRVKIEEQDNNADRKVTDGLENALGGLKWSGRLRETSISDYSSHKR